MRRELLEILHRSSSSPNTAPARDVPRPVVPNHACPSFPFLVYSQHPSLTFTAPLAQTLNPPVRRCRAQEFLDFLERLVRQQLRVRQEVFDRVDASLRHTTINFHLGCGNSVALFLASTAQQPYQGARFILDANGSQQPNRPGPPHPERQAQLRPVRDFRRRRGRKKRQGRRIRHLVPPEQRQDCPRGDHRVQVPHQSGTLRAPARLRWPRPPPLRPRLRPRAPRPPGRGRLLHARRQTRTRPPRASTTATPPALAAASSTPAPGTSAACPPASATSG